MPCASSSAPSPDRNIALPRSSCRASTRPVRTPPSSAPHSPFRPAIRSSPPTSSPRASRSPRRLGEEGFASAKIGEQQVEVNHQTHLATLTCRSIPGPSPDSARSGSAARPPFSAHHVAVIARFQARRPVPALEARRSAPRADRDDPRRRCRHPARAGAGRTGRRRRRPPRAGAVAYHCRRARLRHGPGRPDPRSSWTDRNFLNPKAR